MSAAQFEQPTHIATNRRKGQLHGEGGRGTTTGVPGHRATDAPDAPDARHHSPVGVWSPSASVGRRVSADRSVVHSTASARGRAGWRGGGGSKVRALVARPVRAKHATGRAIGCRMGGRGGRKSESFPLDRCAKFARDYRKNQAVSVARLDLDLKTCARVRGFGTPVLREGAELSTPPRCHSGTSALSPAQTRRRADRERARTSPHCPRTARMAVRTAAALEPTGSKPEAERAAPPRRAPRSFHQRCVARRGLTGSPTRMTRTSRETRDKRLRLRVVRGRASVNAERIDYVA